MLSKIAFLSAALVSVVGCGGDDPIRVTADAKIWMDAPPPPECSVPKAGWSLGLSLGSSDMRVSYAMGGGWFETPDMGTFAGKPIFTMGAGLPSSDASARDIFVLEIAKPGGGFVTGTAYMNDPDPNSATPVADAYILGDVDPNSGDFVHLYWASSGQTSFTQISEVADAPIDGTASGMNFREIDEENNDVAMGCTTKLGRLSFALVNTESTTATGKAQGDLEMLTPAETQRLLDKVHKRLNR